MCIRDSVPVVLGGRGTLLVASLGGHDGRPLHRGDMLRVGVGASVRSVLPPPPSLDRAIRVIPGPDVDRFDSRALEVLLASDLSLIHI